MEDKELTEEEIDSLVEMDDDAAAAKLEGKEPPKPKGDPDAPPEKEGEKPPEGEEEKPPEPEKKPGEEEPKPEPEKEEEKLPEEYDKWDNEKRGLYHEAKKDRKLRQELQKKGRQDELDLAVVKAASEAQMKTIDKMRQAPVAQPTKPVQTREEALLIEIDARAAEHEKEYGEPYRRTHQENRQLEKARSEDNADARSRYNQQQNYEQSSRAVQAAQQRSSESEQGFKQQQISEDGASDYEHVWKTFVEPMVLAEVGDKGAFSPTFYKILNAANPAKQAYNIARSTEEGQVYFAGKAKKQADKDKAKEILDGKDNQLPSTTAQLEGGKGAGAGQYKLTTEEYNRNFDKWSEDKRITKALEDKLLSGEPVLV